MTVAPRPGAEEDEQLEGGDREDSGPEEEDSYDQPLVDREERRS